MNAKNTKAAKVVRYGSVDELPPAPPLSKAVKTMSDAEVKRRAEADPDAGAIPADFWDTAQVVEPEGTEQITLRVPRKVLGYFKSIFIYFKGAPYISSCQGKLARCLTLVKHQRSYFNYIT